MAVCWVLSLCNLCSNFRRFIQPLQRTCMFDYLSWVLINDFTYKVRDICLIQSRFALLFERLLFVLETPSPRKATLIGGWVSRLADYLQRKADILNRGYSSYTTTLCHPVLPLIFPQSSKHQKILCTNASTELVESDASHLPIAEHIGRPVQRCVMKSQRSWSGRNSFRIDAFFSMWNHCPRSSSSKVFSQKILLELWALRN